MRCGERIGWLTLANRMASGECAARGISCTSVPPARAGRVLWCDDRCVTANQANQATAQDEVVDICRDLIRIDTANPGDHSGPGERLAAEHVAGLLAEVGLEPTVLESHPKRTSVVARISGQDQTRPALLVHGHLDVVPASAPDWRHDPFSGEIADGCIWGRGAIDMKDMDAMMLAVARQRLRENRPPARDIVLTFTADEEAGGLWGARWLVDSHPGLFEGVTEAVGEVGGFSLTLGRQRLYLLETAEKGSYRQSGALAGTTSRCPCTSRPGLVLSWPSILATTLVRLGCDSRTTGSSPASASSPATCSAARRSPGPE